MTVNEEDVGGRAELSRRIRSDQPSREVEPNVCAASMPRWAGAIAALNDEDDIHHVDAETMRHVESGIGGFAGWVQCGCSAGAVFWSIYGGGASASARARARGRGLPGCLSGREPASERLTRQVGARADTGHTGHTRIRGSIEGNDRLALDPQSRPPPSPLPPPPLPPPPPITQPTPLSLLPPPPLCRYAPPPLTPTPPVPAVCCRPRPPPSPLSAVSPSPLHPLLCPPWRFAPTRPTRGPVTSSSSFVRLSPLRPSPPPQLTLGRRVPGPQLRRADPARP